MKEFPARLHVLLAREANTALVIRRGPSKTTSTFRWNRSDDTFQLGQWVRARIYERRCDLSPDGKWFIYFAMNGRWESSTKGSWTAISMAPWLKAVTLYGKGDCWHGGGLFTRKKRFWLNGSGYTTLREDRRLSIDHAFEPEQHYGSECTGVYYVRLQRDGWKLIKNEQIERWKALTVFEKAAPHGWTLRKLAHSEVEHPPGKGCYWDEHELENKATGVCLRKRDWEWADLDSSRLVWAEKGQLRGAYLRRDGLKDDTLLHDFNGLKFEAVAAPY